MVVVHPRRAVEVDELHGVNHVAVGGRNPVRPAYNIVYLDVVRGVVADLNPLNLIVAYVYGYFLSSPMVLP